MLLKSTVNITLLVCSVIIIYKNSLLRQFRSDRVWYLCMYKFVLCTTNSTINGKPLLWRPSCAKYTLKYECLILYIISLSEPLARNCKYYNVWFLTVSITTGNKTYIPLGGSMCATHCMYAALKQNISVNKILQ
jgi:hypothetical protein